jgi:hypothetical protein
MSSGTLRINYKKLDIGIQCVPARHGRRGAVARPFMYVNDDAASAGGDVTLRSLTQWQQRFHKM